MGICNSKIYPYVDKIQNVASKSNLHSSKTDSSKRPSSIDSFRKSLHGQGEIPEIGLFHDAIKLGDIELVNKFLDNGMPINVMFNKYATPLIVACKYKYEDLALNLILYKADINAKDEDGCTPILLSCLYQLNGVVDKLLELDVSLDVAEVLIRVPVINTPLFLNPFSACIATSNFDKLVKIKNRSIIITPEQYLNYLVFSIKYSNNTIFYYLMSFDIQINAVEYIDEHPLIVSIKSSKEDMALALLKKGSSINIITHNNENILLLSSKYGLLTVVEYLLENHSIDPNSTDIDCNSALTYSIQNNNPDLTRLLIKKGAKLNQYNYEGKCPYDFATNLLREELEQTYKRHIVMYHENIPVRRPVNEDRRHPTYTPYRPDSKSILKKQATQ